MGVGCGRWHLSPCPTWGARGYVVGMSHRITIVFDDDSHEALRQVARHLGCSASEAVRRAVLRFRDERLGVPEEKRKRRVAALRALIDGRD